VGHTQAGPQALVTASGLLPDATTHYLADFERNNQRPFGIKSGERPTVDTLGRDNPADGSGDCRYPSVARRRVLATGD
jgi:hypothetical protein